MSDLSKDQVADLLSDERYFAFIDVLGYSDVLFHPRFSEEQRVHHLYELWECFYSSIDKACSLFPGVAPVLFSDSLYISSIDPLALSTCVGTIFRNACTYYSMASMTNQWMPWLRAGMAFGWGIDVNDPTVKGKMSGHMETFRNPAGPAPARAYLVAEKSGLKGARILVPENVLLHIDIALKAANHRDRRLVLPWPLAGQNKGVNLFDLPWWRFCDLGHNGAHRVFKDHAWQIQQSHVGAVAHRDATLQLLTVGG